MKNRSSTIIKETNAVKGTNFAENCVFKYKAGKFYSFCPQSHILFTGLKLYIINNFQQNSRTNRFFHHMFQVFRNIWNSTRFRMFSPVFFFAPLRQFHCFMLFCGAKIKKIFGGEVKSINVKLANLQSNTEFVWEVRL